MSDEVQRCAKRLMDVETVLSGIHGCTYVVSFARTRVTRTGRRKAEICMFAASRVREELDDSMYYGIAKE